MGKKTNGPPKNLTNEQRKLVCEYCIANPTLSQTKVAEWAQQQFGLAKVPGQSTISELLKRTNEFLNMSSSELQVKKRRVISFPELDTTLANWVFQCERNGFCLTGEMIKVKAKAIAEQLNIPPNEMPAFSNGWLEGFQARHNVKRFKARGEAESVVIQAKEMTLPEFKEKIRRYPPKDIFNMDETGLFYTMAPDYTIAKQQMEKIEEDKARITLVLATNADGSEKLEPLFIGHHRMPGCFQNKTAEEHGFHYAFNNKALMTMLLFQEWIRTINHKMCLQGRKILLLADNASSHALRDLPSLSNIELLFFPSNTTSTVQPMDAGIIASFKRHYRRMQLECALDRYEAGEHNIYKVNQLQAMRWSIRAWNEVSSSTIVHCWNHTKLLSYNSIPNNVLSDLNLPVEDTLLEEEKTIEGEILEHMKSLSIRDKMSIETFLNPKGENEVHQELNGPDLAGMPIETFLNPNGVNEVHQKLNCSELAETAIAVEEKEEKNRESGEATVSALPTKEKLALLRKVIIITDELVEDDGKAMRSLRKAQAKMREKLRKEEECNRVLADILL